MIGTIVYYFNAISTVLGIFGIGYSIADLLCNRYEKNRKDAEHPTVDKEKVRRIRKKELRTKEPIVIQEQVVVVAAKPKKEKPKKVKAEKPPKVQKVKPQKVKPVKPQKVKPKKAPKPKRQAGEKDHSLPYYLFGIGALTVAGHALLAHHIKNKDTSEERRKD